METVKDIMTSRLVTIKSEATMAAACNLMKECEVRHLPVVDNRLKVVGILSDRDIQKSMNVKPVNYYQQDISIDPSKKVENFMSWPVYSVSESTTIEKVIEEMLGQKVSAFMVTDEAGQDKGIITTDDVLAYFLTQLQKGKAESKFRPMNWLFSGYRRGKLN